MNTCGTCKYFGALETRLDHYDEECEEVPNTRLHVCQLLQQLNKERTPIMDQPAGVIDASGYYAALCVSEDFGCNQWQPKDPQHG